MNLIVCEIIFFLGLALLAMNILVYYFLKNKSKHTKILTAYLTFSLLEAVVCYFVYQHFPDNNFFFSHFYFGLHFLFLSYFYYNIFTQPKLKKFITYFVGIVFLGFILQYVINYESFFQINLIETTIVCCFLATLAMINIYNTLGESNSYFYFSLGLLLYFLCICFVYLSGNLIIVFNKDPYIDQWIFRDVFFIIFQLLIFKESKSLIQNK